MVKSSTEQRATIHERPGVGADTNRFSARADHVPHSGELCAFSEASAPIHPSTESSSHVPVKSAGVDPGILRGESKVSHTPHSATRTSQTPLPPTLLPPGLSIGTALTPSDAPLAARRGKSLGGLKLTGSVIEQLDYPDIPTAFRGSPSVWSPRFDAFPIPSFTDHQSMLLDLKLKCAALGSSVSACVLENVRPRSEITCTSSSVDEWMFARGLATLDNASGPTDDEVSKEIIADMSISLPDHSSTPVKIPSCTAHLGFRPRLYSTPVLQSPVKRSSDPPGVPLPPRPALLSPSTPPHVRGILKKVKSVRFEDMITKDSPGTSPIVSSSQTSTDGPSPKHLAVSSGRPCTPMPNTTKSSSNPAPVKETPMSGKSTEEKKHVPRARPLPKRTKANGKLVPVRPKVGNQPETSKSTTATISVERPCRIAHVRKNTDPAAGLPTPAKHKGLSVTETDVRRGIEGTAKSRLSTPLRNIFRFK